MKESNLTCTHCGKIYPVDRVDPRCDSCAEPLEVEGVTEGRIREGDVFHQTILERYADFFPFSESERMISLREGFTPLVRSSRLASELGVRSVWFKNESQNPTWSFKDRGTAAGVNHALSLGYESIGTVSSGNMAVSVAAYGARAQLRTVILVAANIPPEKLGPIAIYDPLLIRVDGDYGDLYFQSLAIGKECGIYFINSDVPFRVEGSKTIAFEICEELNFETPDFVIVPTSSGGNLRGIMKGFEEFFQCGLIRHVPRFICAQARGCAPIYRAYSEHAEKVSPFHDPDTIAHAIKNPFPPSGNEILRKIREKDGIVVAVGDDEILRAQKRLAEEGIFGQPAGAVPLAALTRLREDGTIDEKSTVVCIMTGGGLKYTAALELHDLKVAECGIEDLSDYVKRHADKG
ncbi:MAG TPA: threonine synthase [Syntrophales bacterium]|nr:threonine synthase [Syntrophales bacterium]HPQ44748.1 threonine synthase [Syntrophales bacterium]